MDKDENRGAARAVRPAADPTVFEKLRELTRNGYVPDAGHDDESGGILFRHDSAPDLVLHADGRIDLAAGRPRPRPAAKGERRVSWRRTFVVMLTVAVWILSLAVAASFIEFMVD